VPPNGPRVRHIGSRLTVEILLLGEGRPRVFIIDYPINIRYGNTSNSYDLQKKAFYIAEYDIQFHTRYRELSSCKKKINTYAYDIRPVDSIFWSSEIGNRRFSFNEHRNNYL
jgi:hypothetical protein